jgi:hypothetical protein
MRPYMVYLTVGGSDDCTETCVHFNAGMGIYFLLSPAIFIAFWIMFFSRTGGVQIGLSFFHLLAATVVLVTIGLAGQPAYLAFRWTFRCIDLLGKAQRRLLARDESQ